MIGNHTKHILPTHFSKEPNNIADFTPF